MSLFGQPFGTNYTDLQNQYLQQLQVMQQSQIKAKEEKVNTLLELMESDPEMKKRFDELMMNKTAK